jgi:hypothetical protein
MKRRTPSEHPNDELLLAYLDGVILTRQNSGSQPISHTAEASVIGGGAYFSFTSRS